MRPKKLILLVDDDDFALGVRSFVLKTRGYRVMRAQGWAAALDALKQCRHGAVDLVVANLMLDGLDGNELARRVKANYPELPVILISGSVSAALFFESGIFHADDFRGRGACSAADVLGRIKVMVARKRGPKKRAAYAEMARCAESSFVRQAAAWRKSQAWKRNHAPRGVAAIVPHRHVPVAGTVAAAIGMGDILARDEAMAIFHVCPSCRVKPYFCCISLGGSRMVSPHVARARLAAKERLTQ